jgi:zinc/manganese transport system permease protein
VIEPQLCWNPLADLRLVLEFPFMVNAFRAGAIVAGLAGVIGWFMVLRRQTFAGHTLAVVGFPGASGAVLVGLPAGFGLFGFALGAALLIGVRFAAFDFGRRNWASRRPGSSGSSEPAVIGTVQALALAAGFLFASRYGGFLGGINAQLFGSFLGITTGQVRLLLLLALAAAGVLALLARPLLFASVDPQVADARAVPVAVLDVVFLALLGTAAAAASLITGSLLVFALLVIPAATAQRLTARPVLSLLLAVLLALAVTWGSLFIAYFSAYPIGFWLTSLAFAGYLLALAGERFRARGWWA